MLKINEIFLAHHVTFALLKLVCARDRDIIPTMLDRNIYTVTIIFIFVTNEQTSLSME